MQRVQLTRANLHPLWSVGPLPGGAQRPARTSVRGCARRGSYRASRPYWNGCDHGVMQARVDEGAGPQPTLPPKRPVATQPGARSACGVRHRPWGLGVWSSGGVVRATLRAVARSRRKGKGTRANAAPKKATVLLPPKKVSPPAGIQLGRGAAGKGWCRRGNLAGGNQHCSAPPAALPG